MKVSLPVTTPAAVGAKDMVTVQTAWYCEPVQTLELERFVPVTERGVENNPFRMTVVDAEDPTAAGITTFDGVTGVEP